MPNTNYFCSYHYQTFFSCQIALLFIEVQAPHNVTTSSDGTLPADKYAADTAPATLALVSL
jgi:hypothetical protein